RQGARERHPALGDRVALDAGREHDRPTGAGRSRRPLPVQRGRGGRLRRRGSGLRRSMTPLELLWEAPGLPAFDLPDELLAGYGGPLGFGAPRTFANFVASIDGVTAIPAIRQSN